LRESEATFYIENTMPFNDGRLTLFAVLEPEDGFDWTSGIVGDLADTREAVEPHVVGVRVLSANSGADASSLAAFERFYRSCGA
jgi:hypothetical protein